MSKWFLDTDYEPWYPQAEQDPDFPSKYSRVLLTSADDIRKVMESYNEAKSAAYDCETTSLSYLDGRIVGYSFAFDRFTGFYIPVSHTFANVNAPKDIAVDCLKWLAAKKLYIYNAKFDLRFLRTVGVDDSRVDFFDVMSLVWNLDTNVHMPGLKPFLKRALGWLSLKSYDEIAGNHDFSFTDPKDILDYVCFDVLGIMAILDKYGKFYLENRGIVDLDSSIVSVLTMMEDPGHPIDIDFLRSLADSLQKQLIALEQEVYKAAGTIFKIGSNQELGEVLSRYGLTTGRATKTMKMKVDEDALTKISSEHPMIPVVIKYRKMTKLYSTYVRKLSECYKTELGGCRFNYHEYNVPTGRLSSGGDKKNPYFAEYNIQSTAKTPAAKFRVEQCDWDDPQGIAGWKFIADPNGEYESESPDNNVRMAFIPGLGNLFCHVDFSSEELRIPANLSGDPLMISTFNSGDDYHKLVALRLLKGDASRYNKSVRKITKIFNFRNLYGGFPTEDQALEFGLPFSFIQSLFEQWWLDHRVLKGWIGWVQKNAQRTGFIKTYFGRIRRLGYYYKSTSREIRAFADRSAVNSIVQGTAGDLMRISLIRVMNYISKCKDPKPRLLSSLHDEINAGIPCSDKGRFYELLNGYLECFNITPPEWKVRMAYGVSLGRNWGQCFDFVFENGVLIPKKD